MIQKVSLPKIHISSFISRIKPIISIKLLQAFLRLTSIVLVAVLLIGLALLIYLQPYNVPSPLIYVEHAPQTFTKFPMYVYIHGAITKPGIYEIQPETRLFEVINQAGGLTDKADLEELAKLNLAKILADESHIVVPFKQVVDASNPSSLLVNLNSASAAQLMELPGVGEVLANNILKARPFNKIEDLLNVSGVGESKFNQLKSLITIE